MRLVRTVLGAAVAVSLAAAPAVADKADALFAKGKAQLAKKQYAEACATFERVDELDPGVGAKLNVAKCYQEWGRLVRAYKWYVEAEKMASRAGDDRAPKIRKLVEQLEPEVPRLTIRAPAGADVAAAAVTLDGEPITSAGSVHRVEPGPHVITYTANGEKKSKTIAIERGGELDVTLELPGAKGAAASSRSKERAKERRAESGSPPGRGRRIAGFVLIGAGAVALGTSGYLAFDARSSYHAALDAHCMGAKDMCDDEGLRLTHDARSQANLATLVALAGAAVAAGGIALYVTAPSAGKAERSEALYLAPAIGDRAGMLVLGGRY